MSLVVVTAGSGRLALPQRRVPDRGRPTPGHSVAVRLKAYDSCVDGREVAADGRIAARSVEAPAVGHWRRRQARRMAVQCQPVDHPWTSARCQAMVDGKAAGGRARLVADGGGLENR
jgi:hypothetical protein